MLYNQTFNLDQVAFAAEGIKDAQQTVTFLVSSGSFRNDTVLCWMTYKHRYFLFR